MQTSHSSGGPLADFDAVQKGVGTDATASNSRLNKARAYTKRLAVTLPKDPEPESIGAFFMNGAHLVLDEVGCSPLPFISLS
jgi:hypothetical protein